MSAQRSGADDAFRSRRGRSLEHCVRAGGSRPRRISGPADECHRGVPRRRARRRRPARRRGGDEEEISKRTRRGQPLGRRGTIGATEIISARPDGYTFGLVAAANLIIQPQLTDLPYRTPDDYVPFINLVSWSPLLAVRQDAPWKTVQEFVNAARATPGKFRVGSPVRGQEAISRSKS